MNHTKQHDHAPLIRLTCAVLFTVFTFSYLYFYQADVMMATQHLLSGGQTRYDKTIGAVLITLFLYILYLGVWVLSRLSCRFHAISYFPSMLALAVLTGIHVHSDGTYDFGSWHWAAIVLLLVFLAIVVFSHKYESFEKSSPLHQYSFRLLWRNGLLMCLMFLFVGLTSNHDDVFHYRMRAETCMQNHDYERALLAGQRSLATDSCLTLLRIHALARSRQLGERLFEYPLVGGGDVMMPDGHHVRSVFYPSYMLVRYPKLDFELCQCLLRRDIDGFAQVMKKNESQVSMSSDSLPKHYREALVLYNHLRSEPVIGYQHHIVDADYEDFVKIARSESNIRRTVNRLRDTYHDTYWYYYYCCE